ncbi:YL1 nuclear protein [Teratosphaeria destructans]|uniref:YL1 nuclear protein n=1 Tax=Teratosphaeria destructans TaxID=418781 RepID=A0A9W7SVH1_9PEZI|nr:YL1 nuclear protein [Teratosphaeria destructans]
MSDDEASSSDGESVDLQTTGLIATRAKRATAGNLYASLRAHIEDEDLQRELLAEDEDDVGEYEGSDKDDDDDALESSSEEEDAGPPQEGDAEDLEGEKELKKAERVEQRKKRKVQEARLKLPSWQKKSKRVKLADDAKADDEAPTPKPKKKSERANWLPSEADAPTRQSRRSLAVANREVIHENLKQSFQRSEKQREVMAKAAQKEKLKKRADLAQEDRLAKCATIAKQTEKEFGRWERDEAERQRLRDEALAAKRARGLDGPFVRHWSGSVLWVGNHIKQHRILHGSKKMEEIMEEAPKVVGEPEGSGKQHTVSGSSATTQAPTQPPPLSATSKPSAGPSSIAAVATAGPSAVSGPAQTQPPTSDNASASWLQGIHDYASQPLQAPPTQQPAQPSSSLSDAKSYPYVTAGPTRPPTYPAPIVPAGPTVTPASQASTSYTPGWPPGSQSFSLNIPPQPPPAPVPQVREQAQRSLVMLEQFENLDAIPKRINKTAPPSLEPTDTAKILLPDSYSPLNAEQKQYLLAKRDRKGVLPPLPTKTRCAIIPTEEAKYFDPKTRLHYSDLATYKIIQRVLAGGCQWSSLLGCWVGPVYGSMGRAAAGVPEGFMRPLTPKQPPAKEAPSATTVAAGVEFEPQSTVEAT